MIHAFGNAAINLDKVNAFTISTENPSDIIFYFSDGWKHVVSFADDDDALEAFSKMIGEAE